MAQSRKQRQTKKAAKGKVAPVRGFKGGDPVAIGRLGGLAKGANAKKNPWHSLYTSYASVGENRHFVS